MTLLSPPSPAAAAVAVPHPHDEEIQPKKKAQPPRIARKIGSDDPVAVLKTITEIVSALIDAYEKNEKINLTRVIHA